MADFSPTWAGVDYIDVVVSGLNSGFANNRDFDFYINGVLKGSVNNVKPTQTSVSYRYTNLKPDTGYDLKVVILWAGTDVEITNLGVDNVWTQPEPEPEPEPPAKWSWSSSNGDATTTQTKNAYTAVTTKGKCSDFSYKVWNDMCAKVLEVLEYEDDEWQDDYASYSDTKMSSSSKVLTAKRFNSLTCNIEYLYGVPWVTVSKGQAVYGSLITDLMTRLNNYIDDL